MNNFVAKALAAIVATLTSAMLPAYGQELFVSPEKDALAKLSSKLENITSADVIGDQVNYQTGDLSFRQVDIELPGKGPAITIGRTFNVSSRSAWNWRHDLPFADWDMEIPSISTNTTLGSNDWKVVGPTPTARCTQFGPAANVGSFTAEYFWRGAHLEIPGLGRQELMKRAPDNTTIPTVVVDGTQRTFNIVTKGNWAITCLPTLKDGVVGEGFLAVSPEGTKYWFDKMVYHFEAYETEEPITNLLRAPRWKASLYATRIEDRFGNFLTYTYTSNRLSSIAGSDGRSIQILWTANRGNSLGAFYHIDKIVSLPGSPLQKTWQYTYLNRGTAQGTNVAPRWDLKTLVLPDQSAWTFNVGTLENSCYDNRDAPGCTWQTTNGMSGSITTPSGLTGTFRLTSNVPYRGGQYAVSPPATPWASSPAQLLEMDPKTFSSPHLVEKTLSGPGVQQTWKYGYGATVLQSGQLPNARFAIFNPDDSLDLIFTDSAWGSPTEGQVVRQERYRGPVTTAPGIGYVGTGPAMRIDTYQYTSRPNRIGIVPRNNSNKLGDESAWPLVGRTTTIDGATFNYAVTSFDSFARPLTVDKWSGGMAQNYGRTDVTEYYDHMGKWVLDQVKKTTNANTGKVLTRSEFDPTTALPTQLRVFGRVVQQITHHPDGMVATVADGNGNITTYDQWKLGLPQLVQYPATADQPGGSTKKFYVDDARRVTQVTDENGHVTCYSYDPMDRVSGITYPSNAKIFPEICNSFPWAPTTISFSSSVTPVYGLPAGHWRQVVSTGNSRTVTMFDALWRPVVKETYDAGNTNNTISQIVTRYDQGGRVSFTSAPQRNLNPAVINTWANPSVSPNALGIKTEYDALGRAAAIKEDSELGTLTTSIQYAAGFQKVITNPRGFQTVIQYQVFDTPNTEKPTGITKLSGTETSAIEIYRDTFGNPTRISKRNSDGTLRADRYFVYQADQQLCKIIEPEGGATVYGYDNAGNVTKSASGLWGYGDTNACNHPEAWASGRAVDRTFDTRNRPKSITFPDGIGNQIWTYTPDNLPAQITTFNDPSNTTAVINSYEYNKRRMIAGESVSQPGWYNWAIGYGYDANASLSIQTYPTGLAISYAPNALGQATEVRDQSTFAYATGVSYHPNGTIKQFTYGNGIVHNMQQNSRQLPSSSVDSGNVLSHVYTYDKNANVTSIADNIQGGGDGTYSRWLHYDGLDRLTDAGSCSFGGDCWHRFTYDALDNLKSWKLGGVKDYAEYVYTNNRLSNIKNSAGATVVGLDYDLQGNLSISNGQISNFDFGNRLRSMNGKEYYRYDGLGRRVLSWRPTDSTTTLSQYSQSGQVLYNENTRSVIRTEHIYLAGSLIANRETAWATGAVTAKFQHTDALGSPVAVTNLAGVVIDRTSYEPYGSAIGKPAYDGIGFAGQVHDGATGMIYMQQRYYDAQVGRFLSVDPVTVRPSGDNFNRYSYAANNPYKFTDPDGRDIVLYVRDAGEGATNFGHMALRVHGNGYDVTFDFGRYRNSWGFLNAKGEGVLRVWTDAQAFVKTQAGKGDLLAKGYKTSAEFDKAAIDHFLKQIQTEGTKTIENREDRVTHVLPKEYELQSNNCTTQSLNAVTAAEDATGQKITELGPVKGDNDPRVVHDKLESRGE